MSAEHHGPSARSMRVMALVRWALLIAVTSVASASVYRFWGPTPERAASSQARYYCPMHPQITSPTSGECPICHMALEPIPDERGDHGAHSRSAVTPNAHADAGAVEQVFRGLVVRERRFEAAGERCDAVRAFPHEGEERIQAGNPT